MKKSYILSFIRQTPTKMLFIAFLFLQNSPFLSSQVSVTVVNTCAGVYTLPLTGTLNGRNLYSGNIDVVVFGVPTSVAVTLSWNTITTRWEISNPNPLIGVVFYNTTNTNPDPPCFDNGLWVSNGVCAGGVFTASSGSCIIPVELLSFSAKNVATTNVMSWQTATEIKNKGFEIERSSDGKIWQTLGFVNGKGNNSSYTFTDKTPLKMSYYRLRQMDFDGQFDYSKTVVVNATHLKSNILVFPNPNTEGVIHVQGLTDEETTVSVTNIYGQVVFQQTPKGESAVLNVKNVLAKGVYFVNIKANNAVVTQKITLE